MRQDLSGVPGICIHAQECGSSLSLVHGLSLPHPKVVWRSDDPDAEIDIEQFDGLEALLAKQPQLDRDRLMKFVEDTKETHQLTNVSDNMSRRKKVMKEEWSNVEIRSKKLKGWDRYMDPRVSRQQRKPSGPRERLRDLVERGYKTVGDSIWKKTIKNSKEHWEEGKVVDVNGDGLFYKVRIQYQKGRHHKTLRLREWSDVNYCENICLQKDSGTSITKYERKGMNIEQLLDQNPTALANEEYGPMLEICNRIEKLVLPQTSSKADDAWNLWAYGQGCWDMFEFGSSTDGPGSSTKVPCSACNDHIELTEDAIIRHLGSGSDLGGCIRKQVCYPCVPHSPP